MIDSTPTLPQNVSELCGKNSTSQFNLKFHLNLRTADELKSDLTEFVTRFIPLIHEINDQLFGKYAIFLGYNQPVTFSLHCLHPDKIKP